MVKKGDRVQSTFSSGHTRIVRTCKSLFYSSFIVAVLCSSTDDIGKEIGKGACGKAHLATLKTNFSNKSERVVLKVSQDSAKRYLQNEYRFLEKFGDNKA